MRSAKSKALEKEYQTKAIRYFEKALEEGELIINAEILYLIGELFRRTGNFIKAIDYFEKASTTINEEKYFSVFVDFPGPDRKVFSKKIREMIPTINRKQSFFIADNVPAKISGLLRIEEAEKQINQLISWGARGSIRKDGDIPAGRRILLNLIHEMNNFALREDDSHQDMKPEFSDGIEMGWKILQK